MKQYTVRQVARVSKRHETAITRLAKKGKIKATRGPRKAWIIEGESLPALADAVKKLLPKGGWHKRVAPKRVRKSKPAANLEQVLEFMEFSDSKRALLLQLGAKTTEENIALLMGLV